MVSGRLFWSAVKGNKGEFMSKDSEKQKSEFEKAKEEKQDSLLREFVDFIFENKKWWLIPIFLVLFLFALMSVIMSTGAAPFLYPLF